MQLKTRERVAKKKLIVVFSICGVLINLTILPQSLNIQGTGVLLKLQSVSCLRFTLHWKILM